MSFELFKRMNKDTKGTSSLAKKGLNKNLAIILSCLVLILVATNSNIFKNPSSGLISKSSLTADVSSAQSVENLGVPFQSMAMEGPAMFFDSNNAPHWLGVYNKITDGNGKTQFFDVNLKTGATNYFNTGKKGRGNSVGKAISGNKLYIGVNDPCYLWEYDISSGRFTQKSASNWPEGACGPSSSDKVVQSAYTAQDGVMYFGTATRGTVFEVDPSSGSVRDFGIIDPPNGNPSCSGCSSQYVSTIAADGSYVYAGMRDTSDNSWWLVILKRSDGSLSASCWKDDNLNSGGVVASQDGSQIWYKTNGGDYRLDTTDGQCPTTKDRAPSLKNWFYASNVYFPINDSYSKASSVFGFKIDTSEINVNSSNDGVSTLKYRDSSSSGSYTSKSQTIEMMDTLIRRIKAKDANSVYIASGSYGPNAIFSGNSTNIVGSINNQSTYAITPIGQYVYLSGYSATTYRWTPSKAWDLTSSNATDCNASSPSNPCLALQGLGKYHYYGLAASDGLLYVASDYARGSRSGGDIAWVDPSNNSTGAYALNCDSPSGFALLSDRTTIAYSSESESGSFGCTNKEGKLFLFNTKTHTITSTFTPVQNSSSQGKVIGTKDGGILGVIKDFPSNGHYTLYKIDSSGKHASWSPMDVTGNIFSSAAKADQNLAINKNGMVYAWDNKGIVQIDPNDGSHDMYTSLNGITYIEMSGDNLYIATGSGLKRIKGVNNTPVSAPSKNVPPPTDPIPADPIPKVPDPVKISSDHQILSFDFNKLSPAVIGIIDEKNHTVKLSVPYGTKVTSLIPTISFKGASITPNTGISQNFTKSVIYTVKALDNSVQKYVVTVKVEPKPQTIPPVPTEKPIVPKPIPTPTKPTETAPIKTIIKTEPPKPIVPTTPKTPIIPNKTINKPISTEINKVNTPSEKIAREKETVIQKEISTSTPSSNNQPMNNPSDNQAFISESSKNNSIESSGSGTKNKIEQIIELYTESILQKPTINTPSFDTIKNDSTNIEQPKVEPLQILKSLLLIFFQ